LPLFPSRRVLVCLLPALGIFGSGCSSDGPPQSESDKHIKALVVLYGKFIPRNRGVGPASEEAFKKFIKSLNAQEVQHLGVDPANIDALFISPRDNQTYAFAWGIKADPGPDGKGRAIVWEQTGVKGKRMVGDSLGNIEELDEAAFATRVPARAGKSAK
jgi:hypothetical protein